MGTSEALQISQSAFKNVGCLVGLGFFLALIHKTKFIGGITWLNFSPEINLG